MALKTRQWSQDELSAVVDGFDVTGTFRDAHPHGNGHIHDTFLVGFRNNKDRPIILQRINDHVFRHVPEMMRNIDLITGHIRNRLKHLPEADRQRRCLTLIRTRDNSSYLRDAQGSLWRCFQYITESRSFDSVTDAAIAKTAGRGYGAFHSLIADFDQNLLFDTIPDFHNMRSRLRLFSDAVRRDPRGRLREVPREADLVARYEEEMLLILQLGEAGEIPLRVTHNDTKINNVLFDKHNQVLCVIDLDTVMPGYIHYDFGDAIRTAGNTADEDETDLQKVTLSIELYRAFTEGFLHETRQMLTTTEIETLAFAPKLLTFIMALRFLTDYIDGDTYYKIHNEKHNLQRARAQFKLLESMYEQTDAMEQTVKQWQ